MGFVPQMLYRKLRDTKDYHTSVSDNITEKNTLKKNSPVLYLFLAGTVEKSSRTVQS